jgi:hypothetical protein
MPSFTTRRSLTCGSGQLSQVTSIVNLIIVHRRTSGL